MSNDKITTLKGIGEKTAGRLAVLGIRTIEDLIRYYPVRFIKYEKVRPIETVKAGDMVAVKGQIFGRVSTVRLSGRFRTMTKCQLEDITGKLDCVWFNSPYIANTLKRETDYVFEGKVDEYRNHLTLSHPIVHRPEEYTRLENSFRPVYGLTKGISSNTVSKAVKAALDKYVFSEDYLPREIREKYSLLDEEKAIREMHFPENDESLIKARQRVTFDEFLMFLMNIRLLGGKGNRKTGIYLDSSKYEEEFLNLLPFNLTSSQKKVLDEIYHDFESGYATNRLIQGDVGSGKTVIAVAAMYAAFRNGYQSAMMVPTEVLANQHYSSITKLFANAIHKPNIVLLTGSGRAKDKNAVKEEIRNGKADIVIGTHALIQDDVEFRKEALVITDEQHRFGVKQRQLLSGTDETNLHTLVMSATPIPRTLAVILYGDLDISVVDTLPSGRIPVKNIVISPGDRGKAYRTILNEIENGHQAYIICPMVEDSEAVDAENVTDYVKGLQAVFPKDIMIQCLHGRMKQAEKDRIMNSFSIGETKVLVSTTVVEVGVDVPNATVMMIENAERFGLASLHQLRGRVGRGSNQSYCIFVRTSETEISKKRLEIVERSNDGFYIATEDLKLRGPGEILGEAQSGDMSFDTADIYADSETLKLADDACSYMMSDGFNPDDEEIIRLNKHLELYKDKVLKNLNI